MSAASFEPLESLPPAHRRITAALLAHGRERSDIEEMIAELAHELAEEIRDERDDMAATGAATQDAIDAMSHAANVIDPQDREGQRRPDEGSTT
ncbi:hypothetical protein ACFCYB_00185 [Streptomyces sp. NPDC056309]|uniref:hypothetical protein n=1 Tax=Streptomyces sp. NPDC056309 TaxID=3345781 RepID=UPI0035DC0CF1